MTEVFLDESGDLGERGSEFFIIAAVVPKQNCNLSSCIIRTRKKFFRNIAISELKASKSDRNVIRHVLTQISKTDIDIYSLVVPKKEIRKRLFDNKDSLYTLLVGALLDRVEIKDNLLELIVDKRLSPLNTRKKFDNFSTHTVKNNYPSIRVQISHKYSEASKELQVADFVAYSIFQYNVHNDGELMGLISKKIKHEIRIAF